MNKLTLTVGALLATVLATSTRAQVQAFSGVEDRKVTRVFYFTNASGFTPKGQFSIEYGTPKWSAKYDDKQAFDQMTRGKRWRFGKGPWTRLDTNVPLTFAGVDVPPGSYYCVIERSDGDDISLVLLDPNKIRAKKLDAFQAGQTKGGISIPLNWTHDLKESQELLSIELTPEKEHPHKVTLKVRWGKHELDADIVAAV